MIEYTKEDWHAAFGYKRLCYRRATAGTFVLDLLYSEKDDKKVQKIFKMLKKLQKYPYFGHFCEAKKSKKLVEKESIFFIFRKIDLIDFFDSIPTPIRNFDINTVGKLLSKEPIKIWIIVSIEILI